MAKYSEKAEKAIGDKMHKMKGEDKPQDQKVAIAMSEARKKGMKVPPKKADASKKKSDKHEDGMDHPMNQGYDSYKRKG